MRGKDGEEGRGKRVEDSKRGVEGGGCKFLVETDQSEHAKVAPSECQSHV